MTDGGFEEVGATDEAMFGPRAFVVSGFDLEQQQLMLKLIQGVGLGAVPACFATESDGRVSLIDLASRRETTGRGSGSPLKRAVVLSGVTEAELHRFMDAYRASGLPRPLWATLTETSASWTLVELLRELAAERAALEETRR